MIWICEYVGRHQFITFCPGTLLICTGFRKRKLVPKTVFFISDLSWQNIQIKLIPTGSNTLHRQLCWNLLVYGDSESAILPLLDCAPWRNGRHVQVHVLQNQRKIRGLCRVADSFWPWRWYGDIQGSSAGTKLVTKNSYHVRVFRMNSSSVRPVYIWRK